MSKAEAICAYCLMPFPKERGALNRAEVAGLPVYCSRQHSGAGKRRDVVPTKSEQKTAKAEYDRQRRERLGSPLLAKKRESHRLNYDPVTAAAYRQTRMTYHVEYCRQPAYRAKKKTYDRRHLAEKKFGEFADAALILRDLENEIGDQASREEIYVSKGYYNKAQTRRRALNHG